MQREKNPSCLKSAFTLLEVLIVVVIIGVLVSIVVVNVIDTTDSTRQAAFISSIRHLGNQGYIYYIQNGEYLEDSSSGQLPSGFDQYVSRAYFESPTPIGGVWDAENAGDFPGVVSAIGVHFNGGESQDESFMAEIDQIMDDGNLATGSFRRIAGDRYYLLIVSN